MTPICYVGVYTLSVAGGWLIAGTGVYWMRRSIKHRREFFRWVDIWVGGAERAVATTLVIFAPAQLPVFVGAWVALKFAANWKRRTRVEGVEQISLIALVGSVISFAVAIWAGLIVIPGAFSKLAN